MFKHLAVNHAAPHDVHNDDRNAQTAKHTAHIALPARSNQQLSLAPVLTSPQDPY